jgi:triosephosphate isomerase
MRSRLIIGNWKMNQTQAEVKGFFAALNGAAKDGWIAPQTLHIPLGLQLANSEGIKIGAQNASENNPGAFTGETAMTSLKEAGAHFVLIGHSERRALYNESDSLVAAKLKQALKENLVPVVCVGETLNEREGNLTNKIVEHQVTSALAGLTPAEFSHVIIAYEPVWAIGTGKTATPEMAQEVHATIRALLKKLYPTEAEKTLILYGGSVKPDNLAELLKGQDVDGGLVGGASLKPSDFVALCQIAYNRS